MDLQSLLPAVRRYIENTDLEAIPGWRNDAPFSLQPLAQGEYNANYVMAQAQRRWVFRVNIASQIDRDDQILYEYRALKLLEPTGVTPTAHYVDDTKEGIPHGVLVMAFLPGESLDYRRDASRAAQLFAQVHSLPVPPERNHLIRETQPLTMTYQECHRLLPVYLTSELAEPSLREYLAQVLAWANEARVKERYFLEDPWNCIINTEVNSGNFIIDRQREELYLVDWEKPLWGDPSQDLSHFCAPMTTLWKTDYRMTGEAKAAFLDTYRAAIPDPHLRNTIRDRVRLRDPFNYLRGISWSAMAWVAYQTGDHVLRNKDTFRKVCTYLDLPFLRDLFDPYLAD